MPNILIIDDDADFRTVLQQELTEFGYRVLTAADGVHGFQVTLDIPVDLVLLDWIMPHRGGLETLRLIRAVLPGVKVIIVTALIDEAARMTARQLGVSEVILKPVSIKELIAVTQRALGAGAA